MNKKFITVLDYSAGEVHQIEWNDVDESSEQIEQVLTEIYEYRLSDIEWMIHSDPRVFQL